MNDIPVVVATSVILILSIILLLGRFKSWTYLMTLMITATWLLLYPQLLSPYVVGIDSHSELAIGKLTLDTGHWQPNLEGNVVNPALSIGILAPVVSMVAGTSLDYVIKFVFSIYPVVSLPILWIISKRGFGFSDKEAFASLFLLIGANQFMLGTAYSRQEVAMFAALVSLYFIVLKNPHKTSSRIAVIVLIQATIVSHYTTAIFFIGILALASLITRRLEKKREQPDYVGTSIVLLIFWTMFVVSAFAATATQSAHSLFVAIANWATEKTSIVVQQELNPTFADIFSSLNYLLNPCIVVLLLVGTSCAALFGFRRYSPTSALSRKYSLFSLLVMVAVASSIAPGLSLVYNPERIYLYALFFCNGFLLIGIKQCGSTIRSLLNMWARRPISQSRPHKTIILVLVSGLVLSHFAFQVGLASYAFYGNPQTKYFGDPTQDMHYTLKEEVVAIGWLQNERPPRQLIFTDFYGRGNMPLLSYGLFPDTEIRVVKDAGSISPSADGNLFYQQRWELTLHGEMFKNNAREMSGIEGYLHGQDMVYDSGTAITYYIVAQR